MCTTYKLFMAEGWEEDRQKNREEVLSNIYALQKSDLASLSLNSLSPLLAQACLSLLAILGLFPPEIGFGGRQGLMARMRAVAAAAAAVGTKNSFGRHPPLPLRRKEKSWDTRNCCLRRRHCSVCLLLQTEDKEGICWAPRMLRTLPRCRPPRTKEIHSIGPTERTNDPSSVRHRHHRETAPRVAGERHQSVHVCSSNKHIPPPSLFPPPKGIKSQRRHVVVVFFPSLLNAPRPQKAHASCRTLRWSLSSFWMLRYVRGVLQ